MCKIVYGSTASFCVENARELGIPAALLLDKIVRLSKTTPRQDGFCWYTARQFEEETSLKKTCFDNSARKLVEAGIVERKNTYIVGTMVKASHFKLICQNEESPKSDVSPKAQSSSPAKSTISEYNKNTINKHDCSLQNNLCMCEHIVPGSPTASQGEPFAEQVATSCVSVRPQDVPKRSPAEQERRRAFAILTSIYKRFGFVGKPSAREAKLVQNALGSDTYWTEETLCEAIEWARHNEFYRDKSLLAMLSEAALKSFVASKNGGKRKVPRGIVLFEGDV